MPSAFTQPGALSCHPRDSQRGDEQPELLPRDSSADAMRKGRTGRDGRRSPLNPYGSPRAMRRHGISGEVGIGRSPSPPEFTIVEALVPPFAMPPQAPVGMWVGQGPTAKLCVQTRHHPPKFGAVRLRKRTQRFLQNIPGVRHVDKRGLRMGGGREAQVQVSAGLSQERPVVPKRGFHRPIPQAVPEPGPGVTVITLRALDLGAGALGQSGNSIGPRAPDRRSRIFGAKRARPSTRHGPFGWSSCPRSCRTT